MWIGQRGETRDELEWGGGAVYWKVKGKFLFLLFHIFLWPRISNFPSCVGVCIQLANCLLYTLQSAVVVLVFVWREHFTETFFVVFLFFYVFSCCCCCKISTYVQNYMCTYILNPIFWRTWKPHWAAAAKRRRRRWEKLSHLQTSSVEFFFIILLLASSLPSIHKRKENMRGYLKW